ncbi:ArsR/SmtB family transcription factor [Psychrobacillus vulpis]|uniref:Winged helix-turn-helix transcriptional regulator n=1 Tax=Psychrobacillus vulpis TaxID=2325572 RepID=A0A544TNT4_9BACI|nr:metalloregulator ArsR/SmtB family transcription factor [Psychrobacillus vulpis]TQR19107.1 winged helix-turn-helix transcriptional regulator [Psychrobacillus vulpis]
MEVLNLTSRKRETYQIQLTYSILWECALGIAAITNTPIINTLERPVDYWQGIKKSLPIELLEDLDYVEQNNTWKALLQLLHKKDFLNISEFTSYIYELAIADLKFICLPFVGNKYNELREKASLGDDSSITKMKEVTSSNPFFPRYIEFICNANGEQLKEHLIRVITGWYEEVIKKDLEHIQLILQTDYEMKNKMKSNMSSEEFVEWATGGIAYLPEPSVNNVLLIPQYIYRPWNIEADIEGTKVFYYPIANESITPNDRFTPNNFLVLKHKALGDEVRLRIVKMLFEQDRTLQDITEQLNIGKSTIHHHLKILRAAKLVEISDAKYSLKRKAVEMLSKELDLYFDQ